MLSTKPFETDAQTQRARRVRAKQKARTPQVRSSELGVPRLTIKHGPMMMLTDPSGLVPYHPRREFGFGVFFDDTRWLDEYLILLNGHRLDPLRSSVPTGHAAEFNYRNSTPVSGMKEPVIGVQRQVVINHQLFERIVVHNYGRRTARLTLGIQFRSGFHDMFVVRGSEREKHGEIREPVISPRQDGVETSYLGLDKQLRTVGLQFGGLRPSKMTKNRVTFTFVLKPQEERVIEVKIAACKGDSAGCLQSLPFSFETEKEEADRRYREWMASISWIETSDPFLNKIIRRALDDIYMLQQDGESVAGLPWFGVPFGRDASWTGKLAGWFMQNVLTGVSLFLARGQGTVHDPKTSQKPGKIYHERRTGEMVATGEAPFGPNYSSVDATQLWLLTVVEEWRWRGDQDLPTLIWPNIETSVSYLLDELKETGFFTYRGGGGLSNHCWMDSWNSNPNRKGRLAKPPIAVCEAQAYGYAAFVGIADIADHLGKHEYAEMLRREAGALKQRFQNVFPMHADRFIAKALDKKGRQSDVISSNPGHALDTGILTPEQVLDVARRLMEPDMWTGWGIRTLSSREIRFNPLDYQVGAPWPHDTAIAAMGMRLAGLNDLFLRVFDGMCDLARAMPDLRLPELFAGFQRLPGDSEPVRYPVACAPQAWSAAAILYMVLGLMNLQPIGHARMLKVVKPILPLWLPSLKVYRVQIGDGEVDLEFTRNADGTASCTVLRNVGGVTVEIE